MGNGSRGTVGAVCVAALVLVMACSSFGSTAPAPAPDSGDGAADVNGGDGGASKPCPGTAGCRLVFVTSLPVASTFGGAAGGDTKCQEAAQKSSKGFVRGGRYRAWLSTSIESAATHHVHGTTPYTLVDGVVIANDWSKLTSGILTAPIDLDENGVLVASELVWTGTTIDGVTSLNTCGDWSSKGGAGQVGRTDRTDEAWTDGDVPLMNALGCGSVARLYCFEE